MIALDCGLIGAIGAIGNPFSRLQLLLLSRWADYDLFSIFASRMRWNYIWFGMNMMKNRSNLNFPAQFFQFPELTVFSSKRVLQMHQWTLRRRLPYIIAWVHRRPGEPNSLTRISQDANRTSRDVKWTVLARFKQSDWRRF